MVGTNKYSTTQEEGTSPHKVVPLPISSTMNWRKDVKTFEIVSMEINNYRPNIIACRNGSEMPIFVCCQKRQKEIVAFARVGAEYSAGVWGGGGGGCRFNDNQGPTRNFQGLVEKNLPGVPSWKLNRTALFRYGHGQYKQILYHMKVIGNLPNKVVPLLINSTMNWCKDIWNSF